MNNRVYMYGWLQHGSRLFAAAVVPCVRLAKTRMHDRLRVRTRNRWTSRQDFIAIRTAATQDI